MVDQVDRNKVQGYGFPDLGGMAKAELQKFRNLVVKLYNARPWGGTKGLSNNPRLVAQLPTKMLEGQKVVVLAEGVSVACSRIMGGDRSEAKFERVITLEGTKYVPQKLRMVDDRHVESKEGGLLNIAKLVGYKDGDFFILDATKKNTNADSRPATESERRLLQRLCVPADYKPST